MTNKMTDNTSMTLLDTAVGNTLSPASNDVNIEKEVKNEYKSKHWCFTFNNYDTYDIEIILMKFKLCAKKWIFQEEIGETGTKHLQGVVEFITRKTLSNIQKDFNKNIHWGGTRSLKGSIAYCSKLDTRAGKVYNCGFDIDPITIPEYNKELFKPIDNILDEPIDPRKIYWIYDNEGNTGKSVFCKNKTLTQNIPIITGGKKSDIINFLFNWDKPIRTIIFDLPRCVEGHVSYSAIEDLKNGLIFNTKFETGMKVFNNPRIIIFSNQLPELEKFSKDRWVLLEIKNGIIQKYKN